MESLGSNDKAYPNNTPGSYYVTQICIGCGICAAIAPENFCEDTEWNATEGYCYVYEQPTEARQLENCTEALLTCPVNAIGSDGAATTTGRKP